MARHDLLEHGRREQPTADSLAALGVRSSQNDRQADEALEAARGTILQFASLIGSSTAAKSWVLRKAMHLVEGRVQLYEEVPRGPCEPWWWAFLDGSPESLSLGAMELVCTHDRMMPEARLLSFEPADCPVPAWRRGVSSAELSTYEWYFTRTSITPRPAQWRVAPADYLTKMLLIIKTELIAEGLIIEARVDSDHSRGPFADLPTSLRIMAFLVQNPYWPKGAIAEAAGISEGHVYRLCENNESLHKAWFGHPGPRRKKRMLRKGISDGKGNVDSAVE